MQPVLSSGINGRFEGNYADRVAGISTGVATAFSMAAKRSWALSGFER
jgi:hypothetical protein